MTKCKAITIVAVLALGANAALVQASGPLYFTATNTNEIWVANTDGSGTPSVLFSGAGPGSAGPVGIDWDMSAGKLFWGTGNNEELWAGNADGSGAPYSVYGATGSFGETHGVAVDGANDRVFFTRQWNGLWRGATDGSGAAMLYGNDPTSVEYDPASDLLYVGSYAGSDIRVAAADGTSSTVLYSFGAIRDLAIDPAGGTIYWVDLDNIWAAPIDGSGTPAALFGDMGGNLRTIDIDTATGTLFLGEFDTPVGDVIWTANADGSGSPTTLYSGDFGSIRGLTIPEPATLSLLALSGLLAIGRRR
ncbi:MAG: PEP-CTERM sorting domain-containing protein [Planctomycetota bacterium]|jgi:hypothetical protein